MRERTLLYRGGGGTVEVIEDPSLAPPLSVVFANKSDNTLLIVEKDKWSTAALPPSKFEPIGIVVIPGEHGVLKDGTGTVNQCGVMSLVDMDYNTPEVGKITNYETYWEPPYWGSLWYTNSNAVGIDGVDISYQSDRLGRYDSVTNGLFNYTGFNTVSSGGTLYETAQGTNKYWGILPSDIFDTVPNPFDIGTSYYAKSTNSSPSPYKNDGSFNPAYSQTTEPCTTGNALSDFKGIVNTKIITDLATYQSGWRTASTIQNGVERGKYPAACCCARFKTTGTKAFVDCTTEELRNGTGFWYFPAAGELGYIMPKFKTMNEIITKLKDSYGVGYPLAFSVEIPSYNDLKSKYSSSTEENWECEFVLYPSDGSLNEMDKWGCSVRAFMRL